MNSEAPTGGYQRGMRPAVRLSSLLLTVLAVFCLQSEGNAERSRPTVVITVDVESTDQNGSPLPLPDQIEAVCLGSIPCGMQEMVRILRAKGCGATFFLNVFEYTEHGEAFLGKTGRWLRDSGQDVELHTHPQWRFDRNRGMMYQYTLEEQREIIREGKELLERWTGAPVVAHRAGTYSADENTLKALVANGILIDSSLFYGQPGSKLNALDLKKGVLSLYGPLYEFPVTVYRKSEYSSLMGAFLGPQSSIRKYDINWFGSEEEAEKAVQEAVQAKMDFIILFLHSYSFIKGGGGTGGLIADRDAMKRFERILDSILRQGMEVRTFRQIADRRSDLAHYLNRRDVVPEISLQIPFLHYLRKAAGIHRDNYKGIILSCGLGVSLAALLAVVRWRVSRGERASRKRR